MSEFDELDRLRDADPVKGTAIPSADESGPRALRERIVMTAPETTPGAPRRTRMLVAAAAVVALIAGGSIFAATRGTDEPTAGGDRPPINPPGQALCIERYSPAALKDRQVAFDGTVVTVDGDAITFTVNEGFKGVEGGRITLNGATTLGGITSAGDPLPLDPGTRLLVAGDGGFAWTCGFTQVYDATVATEWREAAR